MSFSCTLFAREPTKSLGPARPVKGSSSMVSGAAGVAVGIRGEGGGGGFGVCMVSGASMYDVQTVWRESSRRAGG